MGIDHLQLSPELIAALYPESLVTAGDVATYPFLGKNLRSILFVADYPGHDFIPADHLAFLNRILSACKYSLHDIALVNMAHSSPELTGLKAQFHPRIIFLWGVLPAALGLSPAMPDFSISQSDGISVIPVLTPHLMIGDSATGLELKQYLWACLKKLFDL